MKPEPPKPAPAKPADKPAAKPDDDEIRDRDWYTINPGTGQRTKVKKKAGK